jgi:tRNA (guanine37-N1)-methyltransferase
VKIQVITLFPEMFSPILETSMLWKAKKLGLVDYETINLRLFGLGKRKQVDDTPYGGGDGMLLRPEPVFDAVESARKSNPDAEVVLMTPKGMKLIQASVRSLAKDSKNLIIICAHYEGYDERITSIVDHKISIGDYILTGGELAALVLIDSVVRLIPGVLGGNKSTEIESFSNDNDLEFPQYTRPEEYRGLKVPKVLLSGHHANIQKWRQDKTKSSEKQDV